MKTIILVLSIYIFFGNKLMSQDLEKILGVYTIQEICTSTTGFDFVDTADYEIEIVESSSDTFDIQYYLSAHFSDTIRATVFSDYQFQIPSQWFPSYGDSKMSMHGDGFVYNDSIEINYSSGGPAGGWDCVCKGPKLIETGTNLLKESYSDIVFFPNPARDLINIDLTKLESGEQSVSVSIYTFEGRLIRSKFSYKRDIISIDLSSFTPGKYLLRVSDGINLDNTVTFLKE